MECGFYPESLGMDEDVLVLYDSEEYTTGEVKKMIVESLGVLGEQGGLAELNDEDRGTSVQMTVEALLAMLSFVTMEDVSALKRMDENKRYFAVRTLEALRVRGVTGVKERQELRVLQYLLKGYVGCGR